MKQIVEEILDSLIVAHHIEAPVRSNHPLKLLNTGRIVIMAASAAALAAVSLIVLPNNITISSSRVQEHTQPICSVQTTAPLVALTFDAERGNEELGEILRVLKEQEVKATFFVTGDWVRHYGGDVKRILAAGHELGNHSENHQNMTQLEDVMKREEIMKVHNRVKELTGYEMTLFRPPYEDYDSALIQVSYHNGYYPIQWDVNSLDWKEYGRDALVKTVCGHENLGNGSIIWCHTDAAYTAAALPDIITKLKEMGFELVTVSEMMSD